MNSYGFYNATFQAMFDTIFHFRYSNTLFSSEPKNFLPRTGNKIVFARKWAFKILSNFQFWLYNYSISSLKKNFSSSKKKYKILRIIRNFRYSQTWMLTKTWLFFQEVKLCSYCNLQALFYDKIKLTVNRTTKVYLLYSNTPE